MEMEPTPPMIAKKLWNTIRILFFMMGKGISKSKLMMFDLQVLLKQGKTAGRALGKYLTLHHHNYMNSALSCRSADASLSFISPKEYEFSCSNSPVYPSYYSSSRRKHGHHRGGGSYYHHRRGDNNDDVSVIQKVFDILNTEIPEASPLFLPGFGKSPMVRQLRITDSPFPLKETEEDRDTHQVDKAAEEFIKKFYKELKHQKKMASPSPYHVWGS